MGKRWRKKWRLLYLFKIIVDKLFGEKSGILRKCLSNKICLIVLNSKRIRNFKCGWRINLVEEVGVSER